MSMDLSQPINTHIDATQSLALATLTEAGSPEISYSPFVRHPEGVVILISELAAHYRNLRHNPACSALIIESEEQAKNPFARTRLSLKCTAQWMPRGAPDHPAYMALMRARHGATVDVLATLPDFHLCCLKVEQGRFITGFAKAYAFQGFAIDECEHIGQP